MNVILGVLRTEKTINLVSTANTITFIVDPKATKTDIRDELENMLGAKVEKVRTHHTFKGKKVAYVKFAPEVNIEDIATKLNLS